MSKTVVINFGYGSIEKGFPQVTVQIWSAGYPLPEQFIGALPSALTLVELYKIWQSSYHNLQYRYHISRSVEDDLEIDETGITNVSIVSFDQVCEQVYRSINSWLQSPEFLHIDQQMRSRLDKKEEIRVIIETNDSLLRRLPWHLWNFFGDYPFAEMALSQPEYQRRDSKPKSKNLVRILAILGNSIGIDIKTEANLLYNLSDAEVVFLVNPSRQELNQKLWDSLGWDILFFAGHSRTESKTGRIYINQSKTNNSLTLEQLQQSLKAAIQNGLKLAIFNSCDGLGLASALENLNIPTVIVMREPVPNKVAQDFFHYFISAFAKERLPLYLAVQQARRKLQGVEDDFPSASWLPVICQNPAVEPPTWLNIGGIPPCPYRGLFAFREEDAHLFFGREYFTQDLVTAVSKKPLVAVVGASGSGKSSVVFAGLIPSLKIRAQGNLPIILSFRPGNNPFEALAAVLAPWQNLQDITYNPQALFKIIEVIVQQNGTHFILIADQFEELYTLCEDAERQRFLDLLLTATQKAPAFTLVLTLRADFYGHALSYRPLSDALQGAVYNLGPMSREEMRSLIEQPAAQMQVTLEDGLTNKLIHSCWGQSGHLPLLEFALTQLWQKQQNGILTHQAYAEIGGVESAVANHAEAVYAKLQEVDREKTQRIFMQLVQPGSGIDSNRRIATLEEVQPENWSLVTHLASSRLVVTSNDNNTQTVEIVHEALMRSWGRLEGWIKADGEFRVWQEQLRAAMRQWERSQNDEGALLRGKPLTDADYWQQQRNHELSSKEKAFIGESIALRESEINKQKRRRQLTITLLTTGLIGALILAGIAWWQGQKARNSEIQNMSALSEATFTSQKQLDGLVTAVAAGELLQNTPFTTEDTQIKVTTVLRQIIDNIQEKNRLEVHRLGVVSVRYSPDGKVIASASRDGTIKLWQRNGKLIQSFVGHQDGVLSLHFSNDGTTLYTAGSLDKIIKIWRRQNHGKFIMTKSIPNPEGIVAFAVSNNQILATATKNYKIKLWRSNGQAITTLPGHQQPITSLSFSPDNQIASVSSDKTIKLWSLKNYQLQETISENNSINAVIFVNNQILATGNADSIKLWFNGKYIRELPGSTQSLAVSKDKRAIASGGSDGVVRVWNLPDGSLSSTFTRHDSAVTDLSFSPDNKTIASSSEDYTVKIWNLDKVSLPQIQGQTVSISPNNQMIVTGNEDGSVMWQQDSMIRKLSGHGKSVIKVSFSPDGSMIASASADNTVKVWRLDGKVIATLQGHQKPVTSVAFSPDGKMIATASGDKTAKLWNLNGNLLRTFTGHKRTVTGVSFRPDGQAIATSSADYTVKQWHLNGKSFATFSEDKSNVLGVTYSPQGNKIASGSGDGTVKLWDNRKLIQEMRSHKSEVLKVVFSPSGRTLASVSTDNTIKLWNLNGELLHTFQGHKYPVLDISYSANGKFIVSADSQQNVKIWNINLDNLLQQSCSWLNEYLENHDNSNICHH
jgi:WD40 repeat protein